MNDDRRVELYKEYLAAFNSKSLDGIKKYLSPDCTYVLRGKVVAQNRTEMLPAYTAHWEMLSKPVEILDIHSIENGVYVKLRDWDNSKDVEVDYLYDENGLQIEHIIKGITPFQT